MGRKHKNRHHKPHLPALSHPSAAPAQSGKVILTQRRFSGPLPTPEALAQYEQILPGAADRITRLAEVQSAHRQGIETKVVDSNIAREKTGQWLGAGLYLGTIIVGAWLIAHGYNAGGLATVISSSVAAVSVFVVGIRRRHKELEEKGE